MNGIHSKIATKLLTIPVEQTALCLAKIATAWMIDRDRIVCSKELGSDEISAVTEAFNEIGMWPDDNGNFPEDNVPPAAIQVDLFNNL